MYFSFFILIIIHILWKFDVDYYVSRYKKRKIEIYYHRKMKELVKKKYINVIRVH